MNKNGKETPKVKVVKKGEAPQAPEIEIIPIEGPIEGDGSSRPEQVGDEGRKISADKMQAALEKIKKRIFGRAQIKDDAAPAGKKPVKQTPPTDPDSRVIGPYEGDGSSKAEQVHDNPAWYKDDRIKPLVPKTAAGQLSEDPEASVKKDKAKKEEAAPEPVPRVQGPFEGDGSSKTEQAHDNPTWYLNDRINPYAPKPLEPSSFMGSVFSDMERMHNEMEKSFR